MSGKPPGSYPRQQQPSYPTQQPAYPTQQPAYPTQPYPAQQMVPHYQGYPVNSQNPATPYGVPPPPYTATPQGQYYPTVPPVSNAHNQPQMPPQMYRQPYPGAGSFGQPIVTAGSYDPGARFGVGATTNVPPPPPGVAPTAAQMASAQGQSVVMHQRQAGWFEGGPGGGSTFW